MKKENSHESFAGENSPVGNNSQGFVPPKCLLGSESSRDLAIQALFKAGFGVPFQKIVAISELVYFIPDAPQAGGFQIFRFSSHVATPNRAHHFKLVSSQVCSDRYEFEAVIGGILGFVAPRRVPQWIERFTKA